jgi:D-xylose transport system permease protein
MPSDRAVAAQSEGGVSTQATEPTAASATKQPPHRKAAARVLRSYGLLAALIALWIIFAFATGGIFLTARNFSNLIRQTAVIGILSVGMVMVIIAAEIDLSVGSLVGLTGMTAVLAQTMWHCGLVLSVLMGICVGLGVGALQGWLTAWGKIPSFIVTLGGLLAWRGTTQGISGGNTYPIEVDSFKAIGQNYLSSTAGIVLAAIGIIAVIASAIIRNRARRQHGLPPWTWAGLALRIVIPCALIMIFVAAMNQYAGIPIPVLILVAIALAGVFLTQHTRFGRHLYAIGGNAEAARLSGIGLRTNVLLAFCILGALSAIAGVIYAARVGSAGPDAGTLLELDAIAACVIGGASLMGGRGTVFGACLGALFMVSLDNGMSLKDIPDFIQNIVKGGILVAAVGLDMLGRRRGEK